MANAEFIQTRGKLHVIEAARATVAVGTAEQLYQVCQISFAKDGSVFVQCPYFPGRNGILSSVTRDSDVSGPVSYNLLENGKLTSHLVKLSHHPDGNVHFSQDGKILTQVRRKTFNLTVSIGYVFQLYMYYANACEKLNKPKPGRAYLPFVFDSELPQAITIYAQWRRRKDVEANIDRPGGTAGPLTQVISRSNGEASTVFFLGQPNGYQLRDHILLVAAGTTQSLPNMQEPLMILIGGFDPHEVEAPGQSTRQTGMLTWMYPYHASESIREALGTVDLPPPPAL